MIKELILGFASLLNAHSGQSFQELSFTIPEGISKISTEMEWNGMTLFSENKEALPKIWYEKDGDFLPWHNAEEDEVSQENSLDLLFSGNARTSIIIKSEKTVKVIAHFFDTRIAGESLVTKFEPFDDDSFDDPLTGLARKNIQPKFVSRAQWGADEKLRVWKSYRGIKSFFRKSVPEENQVARIYRSKVTQKKNFQGKTLTWPIEISPQIKKFVIHHTGEYVDEKRNPKELMRAIYYYHTISRGWGDIGYNYVIDKQGNIYEGRAGGPQAVGAHAYYHNLASIGISLMGNFEHETPTDAQVKVLEILLADHAKRFGVNPVGKSFFLGTNSDNISGHKDIARKGHGTACPGKNLHKLLPEIRKKTKMLMDAFKSENKTTTRDFLAKSKDAPKFERKILRNTKKLPEISLTKRIKTKILQRGEKSSLEITLKNGTEETWNKGSKVSIKNAPEGLLIGSFYATEKILPNKSGVFRSRVRVSNTPNGKYDLELVPQIKTKKSIENFVYPLQVSGDKDLLTKHYNSNKTTFSEKSSAPKTSSSKTNENWGPTTKVKLAFFDKNYAILKSKTPIKIIEKEKTINLIPENQDVRVISLDQNRKFKIISGEETWQIEAPKFQSETLTIQNYDRNIGKTKYNQFRNQLNFHATSGKNFIVVNELPLEQYLWGLAEEPKTEPNQKKHAIHILARSYALVYSGNRRKFKTTLYDLEDDPKSSQFYLGYDWERYHHEQKKLVNETFGQVLTYKKNPVIGPYFTQSAGESSDLWQKQYPWTKKQKLPYDEGLEQKGHGIGLSGNTARALAKEGKSYVEIIKYFFTGVEVVKKY